MSLIEAIDGSIEITENVRDWREAVRRCGEMLLERGCIEGRYVERMIKTCEELGPYIAVAPGVAIPHAAPEDGARALGVALLVVREGINFGSHNDPVFVVFAFSTPDKTSHIGILKELGGILENESIAMRLKGACGRERIKDVLQQELLKGSKSP
jgi:PTS system ascorbate-specific IIA component